MQITHYIRGAILPLAGSLVLLMAPTAAAATADCNQLVIDQTADQVLGDQAEVIAEARRLESLGADVRIRAFDTAPGGSLDAYQDDQVRTCSSWRGPDGLTKGNLVTFLFSMDRQSAIFYGSNWRPGLDPNVDRIRADRMNAQFKLGNFPEGISSAEAETFRVLNNQLHPEQAGTPERSESSGPSGPTFAGSFVGQVFLWFFIAALAVGSLIALFAWNSRRREAEQLRLEQLAEARDAAIVASNETGSLTVDLVQADKLAPVVQLVATQLDQSDRQALEARWEAVRQNVGDALQAFYEVNGQPQNDLSSQRSLTEYQAIRQRYLDVRPLMEQARQGMHELAQYCEDLKRQIEEAPATASALQATFAGLQQLQHDRLAEGYKPAATEELALIGTELATADSEIQARQYGQAIDNLSTVSALCIEAQALLDAVPKRRAQLVERWTQVNDNVVAGEQATAEAEALYHQLVSSYDQSCWLDLTDHLGTMQQRITAARRLVDLAGVSLGMQRQEWDQAEQQLVQATDQLDLCQEACSYINSRATELVETSTTCGNLIDRLEQDITTAQRQISAYRGSQASKARELQDLLPHVTSLRQQASQGKPRYLAIAADTSSVRSALEKILQKAKRENQRVLDEEEAERRRRAAAARRKREEEDRRRREEEDRRRRASSSSSYGSGFGAGFGSGSIGGSSGGSSGFGGGSSGGWGGGDSGGGSSGGW